MSEELRRVEGGNTGVEASRGVVLVEPPVSAQALLPPEAAVLLVLGVTPAEALSPGQRGSPGRQRTGQRFPQQDVTGRGTVVFTVLGHGRQNIQHGFVHFWFLWHWGAFLTASHGGLGAELVHGDLLAPLGRVGKHSLTLRSGSHGPVTHGVTAPHSQLPSHRRRRGETALLGQRQVARLVDWPRLLDVVVDGRELPAHLPAGLSLAAGDGAVDETSLGQEGSAEEAGVAVLTGEAGVGGVPVLALVAHLSCEIKHFNPLTVTQW